jgi:hypothetical protein
MLCVDSVVRDYIVSRFQIQSSHCRTSKLTFSSFSFQPFLFTAFSTSVSVHPQASSVQKTTNVELRINRSSTISKVQSRSFRFQVQQLKKELNMLPSITNLQTLSLLNQMEFLPINPNTSHPLSLRKECSVVYLSYSGRHWTRQL